MPWTYDRRAQTLTDPEGNRLATNAYSGNGAGRNNPVMENVRNVGPIPAGTWRIGRARHSPRTGPISMDLTPTRGTNTYGRTAFLIHGDNLTHTASDGCIILSRSVRQQINQSSDRELVVR